MRQNSTVEKYQSILFQSTHPLRGATLAQLLVELAIIFQSTHPLRGATVALPQIIDAGIISIHAPLAGCDLVQIRRGWCTSIFQSTHPLRGATACSAGYRKKKRYFNPRTPCGVRRATARVTETDAAFQSTHPLRGATRLAGHSFKCCPISIHAPLAGCDLHSAFSSDRDISISIHAPLAGCDDTSRGSYTYLSYFNPRTPCGVRPLTGYRLK